MVTIQEMKTIFDEMACKNDNMIEWMQMDEALSRCGFKIKRHELESLFLKKDRLSFVQFHSTLKKGVAVRKILMKIQNQKSCQDHYKEMMMKILSENNENGHEYEKLSQFCSQTFDAFGEFLYNNDYEFIESLSTDPEYQVTRIFFSFFTILYI